MTLRFDNHVISKDDKFIQIQKNDIYFLTPNISLVYTPKNSESPKFQPRDTLTFKNQ